MEDSINDEMVNMCTTLRNATGDPDISEDTAAQLIYQSANLVAGATMRPKPHWFLISSVLAYTEDFSRWVIQSRPLREKLENASSATP